MTIDFKEAFVNDGITEIHLEEGSRLEIKKFLEKSGKPEKELFNFSIDTVRNTVKKACQEQQEETFSLEDFCSRNGIDSFGEERITIEKLISNIRLLIEEVFKKGVSSSEYWANFLYNKLSYKKKLKEGKNKPFELENIAEVTDSIIDMICGENPGNGNKIQKVTEKINQKEFEFVCGYISVIVCAYLEKLGIRSEYKQTPVLFQTKHENVETKDHYYYVRIPKDLICDHCNPKENNFYEVSNNYILLKVWQMWNDIPGKLALLQANDPYHAELIKLPLNNIIQEDKRIQKEKDIKKFIIDFAPEEEVESIFNSLLKVFLKKEDDVDAYNSFIADMREKYSTLNDKHIHDIETEMNVYVRTHQ